MRIRLLIIFAVALFLFVAGRIFAGGPYYVDDVKHTGVAKRWVNDTLEWYVDGAGFSKKVTNEKAVEWVGELLSQWTGSALNDAEGKKFKAVTITGKYKGRLKKNGENVNVTSCKPDDNADDNRLKCGENDVDFDTAFYDNEDEPRTVVAFDEDGSITSFFAGEENKLNVAGLTELRPPWDSSGLKIKKGVVILNGAALDSLAARLGSNDKANEIFKASILHELGHLLNLDHTVVNHDIAAQCALDRDCPEGNFIPTMYPDLVTSSQSIPSYDDVFALGAIYPAPEFEKTFCTATGEIFDKDGRPLKGVNVTAVRADGGDKAALVDARSMVSGVMYDGCNGGARYYLYGLLPGHKYRVTYEPIPEKFLTRFSGLEPLSEKAPQEFEGGDITTPDGESAVTCANGGDVIEMASVNIDTPNFCGDQASGSENPPEESKSSGCALVPHE